jgi:hypothetical protein
MNREAVIDEMSDAINKMNKEIAWSNGVPADQVDEVISAMQGELRHGNGLIYDKLVELGLIKEE